MTLSSSRAARPADEREGEIRLRQELLEHLVDAVLPADREPVDVGPPEQHRVGASASAFSTSAPPRTPPSISTVASAADRRPHLGERVERGHGAVDLATAVVGDDDRRPRRARARAARPRR